MSEQTARKAKWAFDLGSSLLDRRIRRSGVAPNLLSELTGIDGNYEGGVRPHSGFKLVLGLDFDADSNHDETSEILDFFPVDFLIGTNYYGYGIVYRAQRKEGGASADVFIDYYSTQSETWTRGTMLMEDVSITDPIDVATFGRFVYVGMRNRTMGVFYIDEDLDGPTYTEVTLGADEVNGPWPGPGLQPKFGGAQENPDLVSLGNVAEPSEDRRYGSGRVYLASLPPSSYDGSPAPDLGLSPQDDYPPSELAAGAYSFAFVLLDSKTGRRTSLSEVGSVIESDFSSSEDRYAIYEIVYNSALFDQAMILRSVRQEDAGGAYTAKILHLDAIIDLEDYHTGNNGTGQTFDPANTDFRQAVFAAHRKDKELAWQETYTDFVWFDAEPPKAGELHVHQGVLLASDILGAAVSSEEEVRPGDAQRSIGEIRWSSLSTSSPELFSPSDRYPCKNPSSQVIAMQSAGTAVVGFARDRQYHIQLVNGFYQVHEIHTGYGIASKFACEVVGSQVFFLSDRGLKTVGPDGVLDDVRAFNMDLVEVWKPDLSQCSMAFDSVTGCLHILNPVRGEMLNIWFNSGRLSRDIDVPFDRVMRGAWPQNPTVAASPLVSRALFLQNAPKDNDTDVIANWAPRIFVKDHLRSKEYDSSPRLTMLDLAGVTRFVNTQSIASDGIVHTSSTLAPSGDYTCGAWLYCVESSNASFVGVKAQVRSLYNSDTKKLQLTAATKSALTGCPSGSRFVLSPVVVDVETSRLWASTEDGRPYGRDMAHLTQLNAINLLSSRVSGPATGDGTNDANPFSRVYEGDTDEAFAEVRSESPLREGVLERGIPVDDRSLAGRSSSAATTNLAFGVRILCPDLDYVLLCLTGYGRMRSETKS